MHRIELKRIRQVHQRHGTTCVEMAFAAPILLILVFGIMQIGYAFMVQHSLQNAAAKGCRAAILPNASTSTVTSAVNAVLLPVGLSNYATTTIKVNNQTSAVTTAVTGDDISVQVYMPLSDVTLFPGFFNNYNGTLTSTVTLRCQ